MKKTKLIKILAQFNTSELRRFKDFVWSPFFNKNEKLKSLLQFFLNFAPNFDQEKLSEEKAFEFVFGEEDFKEQAITKLTSKLYKLVFKFIHYEKDAAGNGIWADIHFLSFLKENELIHEYDQHLSQLNKKNDKSPLRDSNYFYERFLIKQEFGLLESFKGELKNIGINYQRTVSALDAYYLVQKLMYLCHQWNHQAVSPQKVETFELLDELEEYIPKSPYFEIPTVQIWFSNLQLLKSENKKTNYFKLKDLVFEHHKTLSRIDIRNLFAIIQNNARIVFEKKEAYYKELFDLYNFQLKEGIFNDPVFFTVSIFLNIFTSAIILNKLSWADDFLKDHSDYSKNREDDVHSLCVAMLCFAKEEYSEALDILNVCNLKNTYFKLAERRLRLKVYFEMQLFELIDDSVNTFRKYLSKNKSSISDLHLHANRSFVNIANQVFYLQKSDVQKIRALNIEIEEIPVLPEKRWLVKKIEAFLN